MDAWRVCTPGLSLSSGRKKYTCFQVGDSENAPMRINENNK